MKMLIIREATWDWCIYLFILVLLFSFAFFSALLIKGIRLIQARKKIPEFADKSGFPKDLAIAMRLYCVIYAITIAMCAYLTWLFWQDSFNGFTQIQISDEKVKLFYLWPMPSREITRLDIRGISKAKWGKDSAVINIVTSTGTLKSVSNYPEQIDANCRELSQDLAIGGR